MKGQKPKLFEIVKINDENNNSHIIYYKGKEIEKGYKSGNIISNDAAKDIDFSIFQKMKIKDFHNNLRLYCFSNIIIYKEIELFWLKKENNKFEYKFTLHCQSFERSALGGFNFVEMLIPEIENTKLVNNKLFVVRWDEEDELTISYSPEYTEETTIGEQLIVVKKELIKAYKSTALKTAKEIINEFS